MKKRNSFGILMSAFLVLGSLPITVQGAETTASSTAASELLESVEPTIETTTTTTSKEEIAAETTTSTAASTTETSSASVAATVNNTAESETSGESSTGTTTSSSEEQDSEVSVTGPNRSDLYPNVRQARSDVMTIDPSINDDTPRLDFIDVSSHNKNITVNEYKSMKKYGVKAVVIKLTEGTSYRNEYAKEQMQNAQLAGLRVHVYHYSWFTTVAAAKAEASYFVKYAKEIGVPKTAFFINDLEDGQIKDATNNHTTNSLAFAQQIKALGYPNTQHYLGKAWITEGKIDATQLGLANCWIAQYPFTPTADKAWNADYGAWQWSPAVKFPQVDTLFDMSIDYSGKLTSYVDDQGPYLSYGKYFTPTSGKYAIYSSFNWNKKDTTQNHLNKTYYAKGRYQHSNGNTYLSLYDNQNNWIGYVDAAAGSVSDNPEGTWQGLKKYVKVKGTHDLYGNFGTTIKNSGAAMKNKVFRATGVYYHFDGTTYHSLYDEKGTWQGYINAKGVEVLGDQGAYHSFNQYFTLTDDTQAIYTSFNWHERVDSAEYLKKTLLAKGVYHHLNGNDYYSIYDGKNNWIGYVPATSGKLYGSPSGQWYSENKYIKATGKYAAYSDFTKTVKNSASSLKDKQFKVTGVYYHFNGKTYYSIYDTSGKWFGYMDFRGGEEVPDQGAYHSFNQYVSIATKNMPIYSSFAWHVTGNTSTYEQKTFLAKGIYYHKNGKNYYSLYDHTGKWLGYVDASVGKATTSPAGQWHSFKRNVQVKGTYGAYSNFTTKLKHSAASLKNKQYKATGVYYHFNGHTYYSLYNTSNQWMGYVDSRGVTLLADQGLYHNFNRHFKITVKNQPIYSSFAWRVTANTTTYLNKTVEAAGVYHHINGKDYYSLYRNGTWIGYVEANVGKVVK